jgi:hypothetical protein
MVKNPQDRVDIVRPAIEGFGGRIDAGYSHSVSTTSRRSSSSRTT